MPGQDEQPEYLSKAESRRRLHVSRPTLDTLIREGRLSVIRVPGGFTKISRVEVDRLVAAATVFSPGPGVQP